MLFTVEKSYGGYDTEWTGWMGLLLMLFGPILVRLLFEFSMMFVLLVDNVAAIRGKMVDEKREANLESLQPTAFCPDCGEQLKEGAAFCGNCGGKIQ